MILHKLSSSPFGSNTIKQCIQRANKKDKILLTQDAVYAFTNKELCKILQEMAPIYCISDDITARGLTLNNNTFKAIDYAEFVNLSLECTHVVSW